MKIYKLIVFSVLIFSIAFGNKIAVATKVKGLVEIMPTGKKDFLDLKSGTILSDGDKIRTGRTGFAAIIFIDDKSTLKIKGNTEAVISGQRTAASISKKINMDIGTVRATIQKQNTDFVIQTPTSVASVKGTDFWLITDPVAGDQVIGIDGVISLVNSETGQEVEVTEGMSGISTPDGNIGLDETNPASIPDDPSDEQDGPSQIKIYLEGPNGEQKVLVIEYQ
ncbi:MAG: FecR domain-containing protein [Candidatus Marinimicrobia bacterium]|nr:FecR domain-containing protein [Candidatus Neomarinimicrobiota bacterium]